jgi:hypothetical protein
MSGRILFGNAKFPAMIIALIQWLVLVIVVCLLYWVLQQFAPAQIMRIVLVVCVVVIVLGLVFIFLPLLHALH